MALPIFHIIVVFLNAYTLWYDQKYVQVDTLCEGLDGYPFRNRILLMTMWTLVLQTVYMSVAVLNDVFGTNEASPKSPPAIRKIKDALFSVAYPAALYVFLAFWGIYFWKQDLIYPEELQKAYPPWTNHVMHTLIAVFINIEMFCSNINYPSMKINIIIGLLFIVPYLACLFVAYSQTGLWPYIVLSYLDWPGRLVLLVGSPISGFAINSFGRTLNTKLSAGKLKRKNM